jgi:hypothetical protein
MLFHRYHRFARLQRRQQRGGIARANRRHAHHFGLNPRVGQPLRGIDDFMHRRTGGHQRDILAFPQGDDGARHKAIAFIMQLRQRLAVEANIDRPLIADGVIDNLPTFARRRRAKIWILPKPRITARSSIAWWVLASGP